MLTDFVNGYDVRVVETGGGLGLQSEAAACGRRRPFGIQNHLERHRAVQTGLYGLIYNTHPAATELSAQGIIAEVPTAGDYRWRFVIGASGVVEKAGPA